MLARVSKETMYYNREHDFFFYHLMKCGGTTIRETLQQNFGEVKNCVYKHAKMSYIEKNILGHCVSQFKHSFTIVRNPWERMHSLYYDIHTRFKAPPEINPFLTNFYKTQYTLVGKYNFSDWLIKTKYHNPNDKSIEVPETQISQSELLRSEDGKIHIKNIFTLDQMNDVVVEYLNTLSDTINIKSVKHLNASIHNKSNYRDEYDDKSKQFIEKYFAEDIERFEFKF